jgi:hypothetical protein
MVWTSLTKVSFIKMAVIDNIFCVQPYAKGALRVPRAGREIEFRSRCLDDGRKSKSHFNIYILSQLQHTYLYICGVIPIIDLEQTRVN